MYVLDDFDFVVPSELIAQEPVMPRRQAKMLVVKNDSLVDGSINSLTDFITDKDLIIFNDTKVIKSRLLGTRDKMSLTITLHKKNSAESYFAFSTKTARLKEGDIISFNDEVSATVKEKLKSGEILLEFNINNIDDFLEKNGFIPLPPYIKREKINNLNDEKNYQTAFSKNLGAVASPTASLHFDEELLEKLKANNIKTAFITLHVGAGTFLPVKNQNIKEHIIHKEFGSITKETVEKIIETKKNGGRIIAVGTTTLRVLEHCYKKYQELKAIAEEIDIYIYPPFDFKVIDILLTNFHTPKSTLFMLVSAFCGLKNMQESYKYAINNNYRFFSYGDCCLLYKN